MKKLRQRKWPAAIALGAMLSAQSAAPLVYAGPKNPNAPSTTTPIKHLIVLIGENRSFDNVYGTYRPGSEVANLLSRGIVNDSGSPGLNQGLATQRLVNTPLPPTYFISSSNKTDYSPLPTPQLNGAPNQQHTLGSSAPFNNTVSDAELELLEPSLETADLGLLRTGATGAAGTTGLDSRVTDASNLPNTSFQITGPNLPYDSYTGDGPSLLSHVAAVRLRRRKRNDGESRGMPERFVSVCRTGAGRFGRQFAGLLQRARRRRAGDEEAG